VRRMLRKPPNLRCSSSDLALCLITETSAELVEVAGDEGIRSDVEHIRGPPTACDLRPSFDESVDECDDGGGAAALVRPARRLWPQAFPHVSPTAGSTSTGTMPPSTVSAA
jgi:hypothetical protein